MAFKGKMENRDMLVKAINIGAFYDVIEEMVIPGREQYKRNSLLDGLVKMIYGVGSHIKELREKNEERKGSDYAAYVDMETGLATVWDELENIADIMQTDIENNQPHGRKRLNAAMKAFYGMIHWLGIFVEQDDDVARKYLEEAAVRGDEVAQRVLVDWLWSKGEDEAAEYWIEKIGLEYYPHVMSYYLERVNMKAEVRGSISARKVIEELKVKSGMIMNKGVLVGQKLDGYLVNYQPGSVDEEKNKAEGALTAAADILSERI